MAKIIILGSSAEFPFPRTKTNKFKDYLDIIGYQKKFELHDDSHCNSAKKPGKDRRTRSCLALVTKQGTILFDAGPDIRYQLKKYHVKPDVVFVTHEHIDANWGLKYLKSAKVFSQKIGNIKHGKVLELYGVKILPFKARHSATAPATGYRVTVGSKSFVYLTDMSSVVGIKKYISDVDIFFADGSILDINLRGHLSIFNQLKFYKKWGLKKVFFTHIGHRTPPYKNLVKLIKGRYKHTGVAYDGMVIKF